MQQLDLLSYTLTPEEAAEPLQPPVLPRPINRHAIAWWNGQANYYLRLMNRFMQSSRLPAHIKRHEIARLHQLRQTALAKIAELGGEM